MSENILRKEASQRPLQECFIMLSIGEKEGRVLWRTVTLYSANELYDAQKCTYEYLSGKT